MILQKALAIIPFNRWEIVAKYWIYHIKANLLIKIMFNYKVPATPIQLSHCTSTESTH